MSGLEGWEASASWGRSVSVMVRFLSTPPRNTTTVVVAQRISSLRHADLILVLADGKVIGKGKHEALLEACDEYRIIAQAQMGEGKEAV